MVNVEDSTEAIDLLDDSKIFKSIRPLLSDGSKTVIFNICLSESSKAGSGI